MNVPIIRRGNCYTTFGNINFNVITQTEQPQDPKENTIWVNTDQESSEWEISYETPSTTVEGALWLVSSTSFNHSISCDISDNARMTLYLSNVKQYINGEWVFVNAKIYKNGVWANFHHHLFTENSGANVQISTYKESGSNTLSITTQSIYSTYASLNTGFNSAATTNSVDLTGYSKLCVEMSYSSADSGTYQFRFGVTQSPFSSGYGSRSWAAQKILSASSGRAVFELPISLKGNHYIWFIWGRPSNCHIYNAWLE